MLQTRVFVRHNHGGGHKKVRPEAKVDERVHVADREPLSTLSRQLLSKLLRSLDPPRRQTPNVL